MNDTEPTLPEFRYFPDPVSHGCVVKKVAICQCCSEQRNFFYIGPIYAVEEVEEVCPWCIADGSAAAKWSATFNDILTLPKTVPKIVVAEVTKRTPGFDSWQTNKWVFSSDDALVFLGEIDGEVLLEEGNAEKIGACLTALEEWKTIDSLAVLRTLAPGTQPTIYLFQDDKSGAFTAYADTT